MSDRFYTPDQLGPGEYALTGAEAHHVSTVRRVKPGDHVTLFNGDGHDYPAEVISAGKKSVVLRVLRFEPADRELPSPLVVASALPKGDRADFLVEKLTELGVTDFVPLRTERSIVHPRDTKLERLQRAVIEASKQCGRNTLMQIHPLSDWAEYCRRPDPGSARLLAHVGGDPLPEARGDVCVAVGPEGGFTESEVAAGRAAGWAVVSLGPRTLRVETAAVVLAALFTVKI